MDVLKCEVGMEVDFTIGNEYLYGPVVELGLRLNDHNGLVPSALISAKYIAVKDHNAIETYFGEIWAPVDILGEFYDSEYGDVLE